MWKVRPSEATRLGHDLSSLSNDPHRPDTFSTFLQMQWYSIDIYEHQAATLGTGALIRFKCLTAIITLLDLSSGFEIDCVDLVLM